MHLFVGAIGRKRGPLVIIKRLLVQRTALIIGTGPLLGIL